MDIETKRRVGCYSTLQDREHVFFHRCQWRAWHLFVSCSSSNRRRRLVPVQMRWQASAFEGALALGDRKLASKQIRLMRARKPAKSSTLAKKTNSSTNQRRRCQLPETACSPTRTYPGDSRFRSRLTNALVGSWLFCFWDDAVARHVSKRVQTSPQIMATVSRTAKWKAGRLAAVITQWQVRETAALAAEQFHLKFHK